MNFFRVQEPGIPFEAMKAHRSQHFDESGEWFEADGICACMSADGLEGGSRFGGAWDALYPDGEVVVFRGHIVEEIYDGYIVEPIEEIARFPLDVWERMLQTGEAQEYED